MPGLHRPGIYVSEVTTLGTQTPDSPDIAIAVFLGPTLRGSTTSPGLITSWNDFITQYGGFEDSSFFMPYAVWQFFNNGGAQCYVQRVVGVGSVAASVVVGDRAASPQNTLQFTAANSGVWGNNLYVQFIDRDTDRFDLVVYKGGTADLNAVERWLDLSMDPADPRYVAGILNASELGSNYVTVADMDSDTPDPDNRPALETEQLTSGVDGAVPILADYTTALGYVDTIDQALILNLPGNSSQTMVNGAISYAEKRGDVFVVVDTSPGLTTTGVVAEAGALSQSSYAAVYYPWLATIDPASTSPGANRMMPPGGSVVGVIARTDLMAGPFKAPAGLSARITGTVSLERPLTVTDLDTLNDSYINAIRHHPVNGITIMGTRSLYKSTPTRYIPVRRSLIYLKDNLKQQAQFALFQNNDSTTWGLIVDQFTQFLTQYWQLGGLRGQSPTDAFYVICDDTNNTLQTIQAGELHIEVGVAVETPAEFIVLMIGQWAGGTSAIEA